MSVLFSMHAQIKTIETPSGPIETPLFFPVYSINKRGSGSCPRYWDDIPEFRTMMLNAYKTSESERFRYILKNGLREYFHFRGTLFVDSGGLQNRLNDLHLDPLEILKIQENLGADIAATLDQPVLPTDSITNDHHADCIRKSVNNALMCLKHREREDMLLYAVIHGNDIKVMINMVDHLKKRGDFDGFAIGGLIFKRSNYRNLVDLILAVRKRTGDKPLHVFGLGGPLMIPLLTYLGVDSFDSSSYLSAGAHRVYFAPELGSREFHEMPQMEMLPCVCPVCSKNSLSSIREQRRLIGLHNLWMIAFELRKLKMHIADGDLELYLEYRFSDKPLVKTAFKYAKGRIRGFL
jgi:7-cyano-7-deazaguanine tRNA-ribosyltransferase